MREDGAVGNPAHDPQAAPLPGAVIALDVGGTKVAGTVVDARGTLLCRTQAPTNAAVGAEALMATRITVARCLHDGYPAAHANRLAWAAPARTTMGGVR
jgi:glucokinase